MDNLTIVKVGGAILDDQKLLDQFLDEFDLIPGRKILVHGGAREASDVMQSMGVKPVFVDGRRITDGKTLKIVTMVYAGLINKKIVSQMQSKGMDAIGLSGADGNLITAYKRRAGQIDYGFAGDIAAVNIGFLQKLLSGDLLPVVCPITHDKKGQILNTNADTIAAEIAKSLSKLFSASLRFCFEFDGVLMDINVATSVISTLTREMKAQYQLSGTLTDGMIPKVDNAMNAKMMGVEEVVICGIQNLNNPEKATKVYE